MEKMRLYHASDRVVKVEDIILPGPRKNCDFGQGFYLTEDRHIAEEWVCTSQSSVINEYLYDNSQTLLKLSGEDWIRVILGYRKNLFNVRFKSNVIYGLIADDRLFPSLDDFLDGFIGNKRLEKCLTYVNLGNQYCFRNSIAGLTYRRSYELKGLEKQQARERSRYRKKDMDSGLREIVRSFEAEEKYVEHYEEMGAWNEI